MARYLMASASVHATAAICDYLLDRLSADDIVIVLGIHRGDPDVRDVGDAINVAEVRLGPLVTVDPVSREGDPAAEILAVAADRDVDEILLGRWTGRRDAGSTGNGTVRTVVEGADRPVVVVPVSEPAHGA